MDFNKLEPRFFPAFLAAARTLNFTAAAKEVALTQSGISQHIARLEEDLGAQLFQRVNRSVVVSDAGRRLIAYVNDYADRHQAFLSEIQTSAQQLTGLVSYAMPP